MFTDESIYNQQMSRSINFRYSDLSSVFRSSKKLTYFSRLFKKGDDHVIDTIKKNNLSVTANGVMFRTDKPSLDQLVNPNYG